MNRAHRVLAAGAVWGVAAVLAAAPAQAVSWTNCTNVQKTYPHGVGKVTARDRTSGVPVINFKNSNAVYAAAMQARSGLDGDKDGIACEKR